VRDNIGISRRRLGVVRGNISIKLLRRRVVHDKIGISLHRPRAVPDNISISLHRPTVARSNISIEEAGDVVLVTLELVFQDGRPGISTSHWLRHALFGAIV